MTASPTVLQEPAAVEASPPFDVQGHRGARGLKPENTLPAFETALDWEVTTLELDLHYTADGQVVVWHDPAIDAAKCRLDPATAVVAPDPDDPSLAEDELMISHLTWEQLGAYRCDRNPDPSLFPEQDNEATPLAGADYRIVTLAQLFDFVAAYEVAEAKTESQRDNAGSVQFNLETKRRPDRPEAINDGFDGVAPGPFEQAIMSLVAERNLVERTIIQSFDHRSLWAVRQLDDQIRLAALTSRRLPQLPSLAANGASIWSPNAGDVTVQRLAEAHEAGLLLIPWTVNEPDEMRRLIALGVDGLISDRPDLLMTIARE